MTMRDLHYAWPWALNLIFLIGLWGALFWYAHYRRRLASQGASLLSVPRSRIYYLAQSVLYILAWLFASLALMQPLANGHYPGGAYARSVEAKVRLPAHEVVLLVDSSASMGVSDMHNGQTRFAYAKQLGDEFISDLNGEQASLYGFTSELLPQSPATLDYLFVRLMLDGMTLNDEGVPGTSFYDALVELRNHFLQAPVTTLKTVVVFSDGGDTAIESANPQEKSKQVQALMDVVGDLLKLNVRVYTVGTGTERAGTVPNVKFEGKPVVSRLNQALLRQMADAGHGKYLDANDYTVVDAAENLASEINQLSKGAQGQEIVNSVKIGEESLVYDDYYQIPLGLAIAALLSALYMPLVRKGAAMVAVLAAWNFSLDAQPIRPTVILTEATEYARAIGSLDELDKAKLKRWQEDVLLYNKGTIYLLQRDWDRALSAYISISQSDGLPPPLQTSLKTNTGIAYLEKARELKKLSPPPYGIILAMQKDALKVFEEAGATTMPNPDSARLRQLASAALAETAKEMDGIDRSAGDGAPILTLDPKDIVQEIAKENIRRAAAIMQMKGPKEILQEIIVEETFAGTILHLGLRTSSEKFLSDPSWKNAQKDVLATVEKFLPAVLEQQISGYRSSEEHRCQARPWDEVIPLFEKGRQEAKAASDLLEQERPRVALQHIARALIAWQQALALLNKPVTDMDSPCQSGEKPQESKEKGEKADQKSSVSPKPGANDVLRVLQDLHEDDKLPKTDQATKKQVLRPW